MSNSHKVINRRVWSHVRKYVFTRDDYRCRKCGKAGRLECDHIKPIEQGGEVYNTNNLQTLCRGCHIEKTRNERNGVRTRSDWEKRVDSVANNTYAMSETECVHGAIGKRGLTV